jgi:hypothetical protein
MRATLAVLLLLMPGLAAAIAAALVKKKVPVTTVMDPEKAQWTIRTVSSQKKLKKP